jgi:hypothetical protein
MNSHEWVKQKLAGYQNEPVDTLLDMLYRTTDVLEQFCKCQGKSQKELADICIKLNKSFLEKVER